jgi:hypothetical protein
MLGIIQFNITHLSILFISHLLPFLLNCNPIIIKIITSLTKGVIIMENNDKKLKEIVELINLIIILKKSNIN